MAFFSISTFMQGVLALGSAAAVLTAILPPAAIQKGGFLVGNGAQADGIALPPGKMFLGDTSAANGVAFVDPPSAAFDFAYANVGGPHDYVCNASESRLMFAPQTDLVTLPSEALMTHDLDLKVQSNGLAITVQSPDAAIDGPGLTSFVMSPGSEVTIARNATQHWFIRK